MEQTNKPMRRCISCRTSHPKEDLIRMTFKDGNIIVDNDKQLDGRGFYICKDKECIDFAFNKKVFNRACRCQLDAEMLNRLNDDLIKKL